MKRDIEFLFEIGALRFIHRMWHRFLGADFANLTEHHYRVLWTALIIAKQEGVQNTDKIMKMALVHDAAESRAGDVDSLSRQYVERNELLGIQDMLDSTVLQEEFVALWQEYEAQECIEAKIVKDADYLDIDLELREQAVSGNPLEKEKAYGRQLMYDVKLNTKTAKKMWREIKKANPHDWHAKSPRNRYVAGDWSKLKKKGTAHGK